MTAQQKGSARTVVRADRSGTVFAHAPLSKDNAVNAPPNVGHASFKIRFSHAPFPFKNGAFSFFQLLFNSMRRIKMFCFRAFFRACLLLAFAYTGAVQAASTFNLATGTGGGTATEYTWASPVLTVNNGADITITGTASGSTRIVVASGATANITLNGVSIDVSAIANTAAFDMTGATVNLTLQGSNTLKSGNRGTQAARAGVIGVGHDNRRRRRQAGKGEHRQNSAEKRGETMPETGRGKMPRRTPERGERGSDPTPNYA
jgi:hypothetical protein